MSEKSEKLDPNVRFFDLAPNFERETIYNAIRSGLEVIGVVDEADIKKGFVQGFAKTKPFRVSFKKDDKNNKIKIQIEHKLSLKNIDRRDLRDLNIEKFDELIIVKFWDEVYNELGLGDAPGFGDKTKIDASNNAVKLELNEYFRKKLNQDFNKDQRLKSVVKGYNVNQKNIFSKYKWELNTIASNSQWPQETIFAIELFMNPQKTSSGILTVNSEDLKTFESVPIEINFFIPLPRAIPREINMSYKCKWSSPIIDDESQKIVNYLNFELPSLEHELQKLFASEYTYHFKFQEIIEEKGSKSKITHDQILLNPINILPVINTLEDEENYVLVLRYFLEISKNGEYNGILPIYNMIGATNEIFKNIRKYFVATKEDLARQAAKNKKQQEREESNKSTIRKCKKCGWLLSKTSTKCPMCGAEVSDDDEKTSMGIKRTNFDASSSLHGAQEKAYSNKLMKNFDKAFEEWGDAETKRINIVKSNFKDILANESIQKMIIQTIEDENSIKEKIGPVFRANKIRFNREVKTIGRYLIELMNTDFPSIYVVFDRLIMRKEEIFPVLVSYIITTPYNHNKFSFTKEMIWEVDEGKDPNIIVALNKTSKEVLDIIKNNYKNEITVQFTEPKINPKSGKIKGIELSIDLYPVIRVEPFLDDKSNPRSIIILRQFLDNDYGGLKGFIPFDQVLMMLGSIYAVIDIFKEEYSPKGAKKEETKEKYVDFSMLDQRILESKYSYKKSAETENAENIELNTNQNEFIDHPSVEQQPIAHNIPENKPSEKSSGELDFNFDEFSLIDEEGNDDLDALLGSSTETYGENESEAFRQKTFFSKELPSTFQIDAGLIDTQIDNLLYQLDIEIKNLRDFAEQEISSYNLDNQSFEMCSEQVENFLNQIREKQAMIRAYEFEKHRVKVERLSQLRQQ